MLLGENKSLQSPSLQNIKAYSRQEEKGDKKAWHRSTPEPEPENSQKYMDIICTDVYGPEENKSCSHSAHGFGS